MIFIIKACKKIYVEHNHSIYLIDNKFPFQNQFAYDVVHNVRTSPNCHQWGINDTKSDIIDQNGFGIYIKKKFKTIFKEVACVCVCMCDIKYSYLEYIKNVLLQ